MEIWLSKGATALYEKMECKLTDASLVQEPAVFKPRAPFYAVPSRKRFYTP